MSSKKNNSFNWVVSLLFILFLVYFFFTFKTPGEVDREWMSEQYGHLEKGVNNARK